jgi:hemoglobin
MDTLAVKKKSLYQLLGGDDGIRTLVETFYDIIEQDEDAHELHLLHIRGHGVAHSREEQFNYLSGFLGGPPRYVQKHGHSRLKEIHEHVPIGQEMRDLWLKCMYRAVDKVGIPQDAADILMRHLTHAADSSMNQ